jgi:hypothetical protein
LKRIDDLSTECDVIAFHLDSFEVCSTYRSATAGAARRKSASASLSCRRRGA